MQYSASCRRKRINRPSRFAILHWLTTRARARRSPAEVIAWDAESLANIAYGVKTVTGSLHRDVRRHMPGVAEVHNTSQKLRVGLQADVNEESGEIDLRYFSRRPVSNPHTGDDVVAENFFDRSLIARDYF